MSWETGAFGSSPVVRIRWSDRPQQDRRAFKSASTEFRPGLWKEAGLIFPGVAAAPLIAYLVSMKAIETLLSAIEDDVREALKAASFGNWPQDDGDLLEFFILMIDLKLSGGVLSASEIGLDDPDLNFRSTDH